MIIRGSAAHLPLTDGTVQVCITSIPYWGLRAYHGLPAQIWGGTEDCAHEWVESSQRLQTGGIGAASALQCQIKRANGTAFEAKSGYCIHCNAWRGHYGLEPTLDAYLTNTVAVFREVWRVLKPSGTLWLNVGDAYAHNGACGGSSPLEKPTDGRQGDQSPKGRKTDKAAQEAMKYRVPAGLKPKDLIGLPWRVAFALQADGWYLRSAITIIKRNPMPESVTDRPTNATEMLYLLTKQDSYYYDQIAVQERATHAGESVSLGAKSLSRGQAMGAGVKASGNGTKDRVVVAEGRNLRNYIEITSEANTWATCGDCHHTTDRWPKCTWCGGITVKSAESVHMSMNSTLTGGRPNRAVTLPPGYDECPRCHGKQICPGCKGTNIIGHFAAFPTKLPEIAIKAGTSEKGECVKCGTQVERVIEHQGYNGAGRADSTVYTGQAYASPQSAPRGPKRNFGEPISRTVAWRPTCTCNAGTRPNLVLDCFAGSFTTAVVAEQLGRRWVGVELSPDYINIAKARTRQRSLFTNVQFATIS